MLHLFIVRRRRLRSFAKQRPEEELTSSRPVGFAAGKNVTPLLQVALVACGKAHTVVYTNSGKLFAFGSNAEGQLGVGRTPEYSDVPVELPNADVAREGVAKLAAGSAHSIALGKKTGESWGLTQ